MRTPLSSMLTATTLALAAAPAPASSYDQAILADKPVMFLSMGSAATGTETDLSGNGNSGAYKGGTPGAATLPNGDEAADFNGLSQYLTVPSAAALSVPTTKSLTIESWIRPGTLQFSHSEAEGYVYFLGKGNASQGFEYANRMYSKTNTANRPNRISDYAWNVSGGLGSGAYFQDAVNTTDWIHVVDVIDMKTGYISIYKNGVLRGHVPLSQYNVTPGATSSPFNVGTRSGQSWFQGAVGKVAVYGYVLSGAQIAAHYQAMTAPAPAPTPSTTPAPTPTPTAGGPDISNVAAAPTSTGATITWVTDTVSHSQVEYGLTASYGTLSYQSTAAGTQHSLPLSGLKSGTLYHYRVKSLDSATGQTGVSGDHTFTTTGGAVATAPVLSSVAAAPTDTGATITWVTDKDSHSQVEYGVTSSYGTLSYQSTATGTQHSLTLTGLKAGTLYHYRAKSLDDASKLTGVSGDMTFTTTGGAPAISGVQASNVTSGGATITWLTDQASHSQVEYGPTASYGSLSYQSTATGTQHSLTLSGLKPGTLYHFRAKSLDDASGLTAVSGDYTFTTGGSAPAPAPATVIGNVQATNVTSSGATITWNTTTNSHSQVEYGTTTGYGSLSYRSTATGTSHTIPLSGLRSRTTYHYRVRSLDDATGKTDVSGDYVFKTP